MLVEKIKMRNLYPSPEFILNHDRSINWKRLNRAERRLKVYLEFIHIIYISLFSTAVLSTSLFSGAKYLRTLIFVKFPRSENVNTLPKI